MMFETSLSAFVPVVADVYIDIDATIFVQMAAFLVALGMLHLLLFRPYLKTLDLREENVEGSEEEAGEMGAQAEALAEKYDRQMREARLEAQEVREELRQEGLDERREMHQEVRQELEADLEEQRASIEDRVEQARQDIEERSRELADAMVAKVLPRRG